ncbi:MAG TPA: hypothetical protein PLH34_05840 [Bacillota bacterium]|nr:hypothetical protein [Bacillota bacterium]
MRRSRTTVALVTVLVIVLFAGIALCEAKGGPPSGEAAYELVEKKVENANDQIWKAVAKAQKMAEDPKQVDKAIEWVLEKTQRIADNCIEFCAKRGVDVECYDEEVKIGGITVTIDPMRVAGL